jgi:putative DNA primase/helicase
MTAAEIASALGGTRCSGQWWRCVCPVHGSRTGRSLTLALRDHAHGLVVHCHAGCGRDDILAELYRRGLIAERSDGARPPMAIRSHDGADKAARIAVARRIWEATKNARGTPVERYLAGRGITIPAPPCVRWLPACPHPSGIYLPAMVARVDNVDGELIAIHRTCLRPDGSGKAEVDPPKAMLGRAAGGAVRLAPAAEMLMVAEGVETALAAMQATGQPAWAALSTSGMTALMLPATVRTVILLADNDANGAGERAAHAAAQRFLAEGRRVRLALPPEPGTDFADVLSGCAYAEIRDAAA